MVVTPAGMSPPPVTVNVTVVVVVPVTVPVPAAVPAPVFAGQATAHPSAMELGTSRAVPEAPAGGLIVTVFEEPLVAVIGRFASQVPFGVTRLSPALLGPGVSLLTFSSGVVSLSRVNPNYWMVVVMSWS